MTDRTNPGKRVDSASRVIHASAESVYSAFLTAEAMSTWLPPEGMTGHVFEFDATAGGVYHMALIHQDAGYSGKNSDNTDIIKGNFVDFKPNERIVQSVEFDSEDPIYAGIMTMTWKLEPSAEGTKVTVLCEDVPTGIRKEDHDVGLNSTLEKLAAYVEAPS